MGIFFVRARATSRSRIAGGLVLACLIALTVPQIADAATTIVRPNAMTGWALENQDLNADNGAPTGRFVTGPATSPAGYGSFRQQAPQGDKQALITVLHNGDALADLTGLSYAAYTTVTDPTILSSVLKLAVDKDGNGTTDTTLVYEPYEQAQYGTGQAAASNVWQTWNALQGSWWSTTDGGVSGPRKSLSTWNTDFGGAAAIAVATPSGVRLEVGSTGTSWPDFVGYIDSLVVGDATYDFEPVVVSPDAMAGWSYEHQDLNAGNGAPGSAFVNGPAAPASGYGSLSQTVLQGDKEALITTNHNGQTLASIDALSYATHVTTSTTPVYPAALKLDVDEDGNGTADTTLVYEPIEQAGTAPAPVANTWQTWDALAGRWWSTKDGGPSVVKSFADWSTEFGTTAAIATLTQAGVRIEAGSTGTSWPDHVGSIDAVVVGLATYDFETLLPDAPVISSPAQDAALNTTSVTIAGTTLPRGSVAISEGETVLKTVTAEASGSWTATHTFAVGLHSITATVTDAEGSESDASAGRSFTVDTTPPAMPIISAPSAGATVSTPTVAISGVAEPRSTVTVKEAGVGIATVTTTPSGSWTTSVSLGNGPHTVTASAVDAAGNAGAASAPRSFTVNTSLPNVPVISAPSANANLKSGAVTISGTAQPNLTVTVTEGATVIGTTTALPSGAWSIPGAFADGSHAIKASASDGVASSPASPTRAFAVDTLAPPAATIDTPTEAAQFTSRTVSVTGTAESGATVVLKEGAATRGATRANPAGAWSMNLTLGEGNHTLTAIARDAAGNESPAVARSFSIDSVKPTVSFTTADSAIFMPGTPVKIEGKAGDANGIQTVEVAFYNTLDGELVETVQATLTQTGTTYTWVAEPTMLALGGYDVVATATDSYGNTATGSISIIDLN